MSSNPNTPVQPPVVGKRRPNQQLLPTLFDRLFDNAPQKLKESELEYAVDKKQMMNIVRRDLAFLFNTSSVEREMNRELFPQVAQSVVNYGIPPLAGEHMASKSWQEMEGIIRRAIIDFEPRIIANSLIIKPMDNLAKLGDKVYNMMAFTVKGQIYLEPYPLEFTIQSAVDVENSRFKVIKFST